MNSLCLAIYGMFIAIFAPKAKASRAVLCVTLVAVFLHVVFNYLPVLNRISSGITVSVSAIVAALIGAWIFPREEEEDQA